MMHITPVSDQLHRHTFFELVYVVRGSAVHYIGTEAAPLRAGDYFIIDTGSMHCYQETEDFEIVNCLFLPACLDRALTNCPSLSALLSNQVLRLGVPVDLHMADRIYHDEDGKVFSLIQAMETEYDTKQTGYMELLRCHLTQILVHMVRVFDQAEQAHTSHPATALVAEYLRKHFAEALSLNEISHHAGYAPQYLSSLFRRDTGMSMQVFLQRLRIEEACRLLGNTEIRLPELAQAVGYGDTKHFSRVFKRHKGMSPREFKSVLVKKNDGSTVESL